MFFIHSKKLFSDILGGMTSKAFSLAALAGLIPSYFCMTSALNIIVVQFTFCKYLQENVTSCTFCYIVSLKRNTWLFEGFLKIGIPHGTMRYSSHICPPSYDSLKEALVNISGKVFEQLCLHLLPKYSYIYQPIFPVQVVSPT